MPNLSDLISGRSEELLKEYFDLLSASKTDETLVSKLDAYDPDLVDPCVFGIIIDTDDLDVPFGLREAGIRAKIANGDIDDDTLDLAIEYRLRKLDVLVEIEDITAIADLTNLVSAAAAAKISLSFLPPKDTSNEAFERYCSCIEEATKAYLNQPNILQFVMPVSSYMEYMFLELLNPERAKSFVPDNEYVLRIYHSQMTLERSDAMKARIRTLIHDHFGGEEGFKDFALDLVGAICESVDESVALIAPPAATQAAAKNKAKGRKKPANTKKSAVKKTSRPKNLSLIHI